MFMGFGACQPVQGDRNRGFLSRKNCHLPEFAVLPRMSTARLEQELRKLSHDDLVRAGRFRFAPVERLGKRVYCVAVDKRAADKAREAGHSVLWRAENGDFLTALERAAAKHFAEEAAFALARRSPEMSAMRRFDGRQMVVLSGLATGFGMLVWQFPQTAGAVLTLLFATLFLSMSALRLMALRPPLECAPPPQLTDAQLPVYSVLVPLYKEPAVLHQITASLKALDYPADRLDIKLVVEEDDDITRSALADIALPDHFEVITVPDIGPHTKPKALNHALHLSRGELVTIFDAEDIPHPRQLRIAAEHFAAAPENLACLQARLTWYNANETWLTRLFAIEYASHFEVILPMLAEMEVPLPLGGTSNHFRLDALKGVGGWDPFNVTEDADLGFRLARAGWRTGCLPSVTWEEACCTVRPWILQRARWMKGWMQTWLVHMRRPLAFMREAGAGGLFTLHGMLGAEVFAALAHPFFVAITLRDVIVGGSGETDLWATVETALGAMVLAAGYGATMLCGALGLYRRGLLKLWPWLLALPLYWMLLSAAAWLALWDFLFRPHHWRKTQHGVSSLVTATQTVNDAAGT